MEALKDKITRASKSTNAGFKRKEIRSMKREADKINEKIAASKAKLESIKPRVTIDPISRVLLKLYPPNRSKCIEAKIAEINKKIRRVKNRRNKECLIAKREALRAELNWACQVGPASRWGPRQLEGAFSGAYRRYRIDGITGMDQDTYFSRVRKFLIELLKKESRTGAVELVELAFNSRMVNVYNLSNMNEIVNAHMKQQIENPALWDSKFVFDEVLHMDIDFHRLNLTRGSSYLPLPDWLAKKKAIINPKNSDRECFKWALIAALRGEEIDRGSQRISKFKRFEANFDWSGVGFPVSFSYIKGFESRNQISINVLATEDRQIYICRKGGNYEHIANLMLITETTGNTTCQLNPLAGYYSSKIVNTRKDNTFV